LQETFKFLKYLRWNRNVSRGFRFGGGWYVYHLQW